MISILYSLLLVGRTHRVCTPFPTQSCSTLPSAPPPWSLHQQVGRYLLHKKYWLTIFYDLFVNLQALEYPQSWNTKQTSKANSISTICSTTVVTCPIILESVLEFSLTSAEGTYLSTPFCISISAICKKENCTCDMTQDEIEWIILLPNLPYRCLSVF
jgi:hypothetical protein